MKLSRQLPSQPRRDAWVEVDLGALEKNALMIGERVAPDKKLMAILKADAYGHGAVMCLPTLEASGVSMIGVASIDEALQIRQAGIAMPILVIGLVPDWSLKMAVEEDIQLTVFDAYRLESLKQVYELTRKPVPIQVKVDTGMHRIGVDWREAAAFIKTCQESPYVKLEGVFSHFATPSDVQLTQLQLARWQEVLAAVNPLPSFVHIANSEGAFQYPDAPGNLVRVGLALFGYSDPALLPVMGVKARIMHLQDIQPESGISYGHTYHTPSGKPSKIATLPLGYADGVPRSLSNQMTGLLRGHRIRQVGTITMDQMMFDVTGLPEDSPARVGESITLLGQETDMTGNQQRITLSDWAKLAKTIEYELMCGLRVRLPRVYTR